MAIQTLSSWSSSMVVESTNEIGRACCTSSSKPLRLFAVSATTATFASSPSPTQGPIFHEGATTIGHPRLGRWSEFKYGTGECV